MKKKDAGVIFEWIDENAFFTGLDPDVREFDEEELVVNAVKLESYLNSLVSDSEFQTRRLNKLHEFATQEE